MHKSIFIALILSLIFVGCEKDVDQFIPNPGDPDPITFSASAFVEVTDAAGNPLPDVAVHLENAHYTTDEDGVAHLVDVDMHPATYLTVEKNGYFHGSRRFYPSAGKTHFVKIILLQEVLAGTVGNTGGSVSLAGGVTLDFPADAFKNSDGTPFSGTASVYAQPITADDPDLSDKMPGDLVGVTEDGDSGALASMGMVAVEIRSASGAVLNVRDGATVEMRMDVPASLLSNAPATIPMWYFDEAKGIWIEDGQASLQGNAYVAQVEHFTYWNYDAWFPIVKWGATFLYDNGEPASQVSVCITILELETTKCALTNEDGLVCGMVAAGELLLMEVKDPCGNVVFSQQIGPFSDTTMTGPYTIPSGNVQTTEVSGLVVDCEGEPVTNGFVKIQIGGTTLYVELEDDGSFETTGMNCDESDVTITAVDEAELKQSLPQTFDFAPVIDAGTITACEDLMEFISIEVEGYPDPYIFLLPTASVVQGSTTRIFAQDSTGQNQFFFMAFPGTETGTYDQVTGEIGLELEPGLFAYVVQGSLVVTVTYYGDPGDFIQGTFVGTLQENPGGGGTTYPMTGTFSAIRQ